MHKGARYLGPCVLCRRYVEVNMESKALQLREDLVQRYEQSYSDLSMIISYWDVIGVLIATLLLGFVLGYQYAIKAVTEAREKAMMKEKGKTPQYRTCGMQTQCFPSRTIGTQSQCTYKRKLVTPRFCVLPQTADGVSDVTFSSESFVD